MYPLIFGLLLATMTTTTTLPQLSDGVTTAEPVVAVPDTPPIDAAPLPEAP